MVGFVRGKVYCFSDWFGKDTAHGSALPMAASVCATSQSTCPAPAARWSGVRPVASRVSTDSPGQSKTVTVQSPPKSPLTARLFTASPRTASPCSLPLQMPKTTPHRPHRISNRWLNGRTRIQQLQKPHLIAQERSRVHVTPAPEFDAPLSQPPVLTTECQAERRLALVVRHVQIHPAPHQLRPPHPSQPRAIRRPTASSAAHAEVVC